MTTLLDRIASVATAPLTRRLTVEGVTDVAAGLVRIDLSCSAPPRWEAGQKIQLQARGFEFRTYTPFGWDGDRVSVLAALHANGPGTALIRSIEPGRTFNVLGPGRAIDLSRLATPPILIGDETSLGLGAAWELASKVPAAAHIYEVAAPQAAADACDAVKIRPPLFVRRAGEDHLPALCEIAVDRVTANPDATVVLTGKAQTIRAVRAAFKAASLAPPVRVKAHWDPRRSGLD